MCTGSVRHAHRSRYCWENSFELLRTPYPKQMTHARHCVGATRNIPMQQPSLQPRCWLVDPASQPFLLQHVPHNGVTGRLIETTAPPSCSHSSDGLVACLPVPQSPTAVIPVFVTVHPTSIVKLIFSSSLVLYYGQNNLAIASYLCAALGSPLLQALVIPQPFVVPHLMGRPASSCD